MQSDEQHGSGPGATGLRPPSKNPASRNGPDLQPPGSMPDPAGPDSTALRRVWIALSTMLALGLGVVFVLPQLISEPQSTLEEETPAASMPAPVDNATARTGAEQTLQAFLHLRAKLELVNAGVWGEPDWSEAADDAVAGDRQFARRRFDQAAQAYTRGLRRLEGLEGSRETRLAAALEAGQRALDNDDPGEARVQFERVLAIAPDNAPASRALARAGVRADVLHHMEAGKRAEAAGDPEAAREAYQAASRLDPEYTPGAAALRRVTDQLADSGYRAAMSRALADLDSGRLGAAGQALDEAAGYRPDDSAVGDARRRLAGARQQASLNKLRRQASARVRAEDWQAASALYQKALAVDANAGFASAGLAQASDRARLHQQLDHYLADPGRLYSPEPLANAGQLLASAAGAPESEPRLAEKIAKLERHMAAARTPVPVTLRSDGETSVVIYHVGRLGQFLDHRLELLPGTYTAVGSRPGYRDVRRVFTVQPDAASPSVAIRCEEPV